MKKVYEAPKAVIEEYALTQTIAACENMKIGLNNSECVKNDTDATTHMISLALVGWFLDAGSCVEHAIGMTGNDGICYHTNSNSAFSS